ncbi:transcriptional regulator, partial [Streptomyces sp. NPDC046939]
PSTLTAWESDRDPSGEVRTKYAYFLEGLSKKLAGQEQPEPAPTAGQDGDAANTNAADDDVESLAVPEPYVLCGEAAVQRAAGFTQHPDPADRGTSTQPQPPAPVPAAGEATAPATNKQSARPAASRQPSGRSAGRFSRRLRTRHPHRAPRDRRPRR